MVRLLEPVTPSTLASIRATPGATARARPVLDTTAIVGLFDDQMIVLPVCTTPAPSRTVADKSSASPTSSCCEAGVTLTALADTVVTAIDAVANFPSDDANTKAFPTPTVLTTPSTDTLTTLGAPEVQLTTRCPNGAPPASSAVAVRRAEPPSNSATDGGSMRRFAIGDGETTIVAAPTLPSLVIAIVADPGAAAVTVPSLATRAMLTLLLAKASGRPESRLPLSSVICTVSLTVWPTVRAACAGDTTTAPTGRALTRIVALPLRPPLVAVIVADPGAMPKTTPDDDTVAIAAALVVHTTASFSRPPAESTAMAVSCVDCPTTTLSRVGVRRTAATGTGATVTPTDALRDSLLAVIVATPGAMPVSSPEISTPTSNGSLVVQKTGRSLSGAPVSSSVRASSCRKPPTSNVGEDGESCTDATARAVTVTRDTALRPSILAAIWALPTRTAVTSPTLETRATVVSLLDHTTRRSGTAWFASPRAVACSATVLPSLSENCGSDSCTDTTGVSSGVGPAISPIPRQALPDRVASATSESHATARQGILDLLVGIGAADSCELSRTRHCTSPDDSRGGIARTWDHQRDTARTLSSGQRHFGRPRAVVSCAVAELPFHVEPPAERLAIRRGAAGVRARSVDRRK